MNVLLPDIWVQFIIVNLSQKDLVRLDSALLSNNERKSVFAAWADHPLRLNGPFVINNQSAAWMRTRNLSFRWIEICTFASETGLLGLGNMLELASNLAFRQTNDISVGNLINLCANKRSLSILIEGVDTDWRVVPALFTNIEDSPLNCLRLHLTRANLRPSKLEALFGAALSKLQSIVLEESFITDEDMRIIATCCSNLRAFSTISQVLTKIGILALSSHCKHLKEIAIPKSARVSGRALYELVGCCPELTDVEMNPGMVITESLNATAQLNCSRLQSLHFTAHPKQPCIRALVRACCNLRSLRVSWHTLVNFKEQSDFDFIERLHELELSSYDKPPSAGLQHVLSAPLENLRILALSMSLDHKCDDPDLLVRALEPCTKLTTLRLTGIVQYARCHLSAIARCRNLTHLDWRGKAVDDGEMRRLSKACPFLRHVRLARAGGITDLGFIALVSGCRHIELLSLTGCALLTDASLNALCLYGRHLDALNLHGSKALTEAAIMQFVRSCGRLRRIALSPECLSPVSAQVLKKERVWYPLVVIFAQVLPDRDEMDSYFPLHKDDTDLL